MTIQQTTTTLIDQIRPENGTETRRVLLSIAEMRRFKPDLRHWTPRYDGGDELIGISWQGEPVLTLYGTIQEFQVEKWNKKAQQNELVTVHGLIFDQNYLAFLQDHFGNMVIANGTALRINYHNHCSVSNGTITRPCQQGTEYDGSKHQRVKVGKTFFTQTTHLQVGDIANVVIALSGDTREGYEEALGYYLVK